jgi:hypothetical protein
VGETLTAALEDLPLVALTPSSRAEPARLVA